MLVQRGVQEIRVQAEGREGAVHDTFLLSAKLPGHWSCLWFSNLV